MIKIITLIPTHRNDGSEVSKAEWMQILQRFGNQFGGVTVAGKTEGRWIDPESNETFCDTCWQLFVVVEASREQEVELLVTDIGRQLGQLAMYYEVQTPTIRFLNTSG